MVTSIKPLTRTQLGILSDPGIDKTVDQGLKFGLGASRVSGLGFEVLRLRV